MPSQLMASHETPSHETLSQEMPSQEMPPLPTLAPDDARSLISSDEGTRPALTVAGAAQSGLSANNPGVFEPQTFRDPATIAPLT